MKKHWLKRRLLSKMNAFDYNSMELGHIITRGVQKIRRQMLPFLHWLSNRAGITAHNTVTYMQLIGYNMLGVSRLRTLQLSSRQRYIA